MRCSGPVRSLGVDREEDWFRTETERDPLGTNKGWKQGEIQCKTSQSQRQGSRGESEKPKAR
jgi:hypothetical protein